MSQLRRKIDDIDDAFGHWFAGFVDGEGYFGAAFTGKQFNIRFTLKLRADESDIIREIREKLGVGQIHFRPSQRKDWNPQVEFSVRNVQDIVSVLIPLFDTYPLRAKKRKDYQIWREFALKIYPFNLRHRYYPGERYPYSLKRCLMHLCQQLKQSHKYREAQTLEGKEILDSLEGSPDFLSNYIQFRLPLLLEEREGD